MRLLFLFLLLVNGLIYLWYHLNPQPSDAASTLPQSSAPRLLLLSELPPQEPPPDTETETAINDEDAQPAAVEQRCYTLGPFMNDADLSQATQALALSGHSFAKRVSNKKEQVGYWVYLPPFATVDAARRKAEELKSFGDKHLFVVSSPPRYANAISMGVFRDRENAQQRYQKLKAQGYEVKLEGRHREEPVYWVDYTELGGSGTLDLRNLSGARSLPRTCEEASQSQNTPTTSHHSTALQQTQRG